MNQEEKRNRVICNSCKKVFDIHEAVTKQIKLYNINVPEKRCPYCSSTFRMVEVPGDLDLFLYVNYDDRYYNYPDKRKN